MNPTAGNLSRDRESVVSWQLSTKLDQYTTSQRFTVFSGSYNVNGRSPDSHLRDWLAIDKEPPDIYVLGFQVRKFSSNKKREFLGAAKGKFLNFHNFISYFLL